MKRTIFSLTTWIVCLLTWGQTISLYKLDNGKGLSMSVTNYGARIVSLNVPDKNGRSEDIVCGFDTLEQYRQYKQNYGATVGRYIGRILGAQFTLDGQTYHLDAESNGHCSHGGKPGFANQLWNVVKQKRNKIVLNYTSPDGESGFPGTLSLTVTMTLTSKNELKIEYKAKTDKPTVLNPSNHSFFNLSADFNTTVNNHILTIDGDSIAVYDDKKCVTGEMMEVEGSAFDFRNAQSIGRHIDDDDAQLKVTGGYDHCYRLNHPGNIKNIAARVVEPKSGRIMEVLTTEPGLQIYTGNGLKANHTGKGGIAYARRTAVCFETMHFADSPNKPHWPSTVLRPGETFKSTTIYRFKVD